MFQHSVKYAEEHCVVGEKLLCIETVAIGKAEIITDYDEKIQALRLICNRFLPKHMEHFDKAVAGSIDRTTVVRITLTEPPVGKSKP